MLDITALISELNNLANDPQWRGWPFGPGFGGTWSAVARFAFVALILGFIVLFLRVLFGPKGIFRDHELDREAEEMRKAELEELENKFKSGKISELEYKFKKREIES
ncbi:hypothetical protein [Maridesulfovibrio bastinii]|uniref:hypothetical protein n=1 Tax=Maridesulfovibrio bastinii TaxID=47157 RepID=UPI0004053616|nr:hypothetical protein [Maridesulfovibrio bastinii]